MHAKFEFDLFGSAAILGGTVMVGAFVLHHAGDVVLQVGKQPS